MKTYLVSSVVVIVAAAVAWSFFPPGTLAGGSVCPPNPAPGTHVTGGLDVDGVCILDDVTVNGGVTVVRSNVNGTGHLQLGLLHGSGAVVNGGILVNGGELDVNAATGAEGVSGTSEPTGTSSTVNGGIIINSPIDTDIWTARINGGIIINGPYANATAGLICGNDVRGVTTFSNFNFQIGGGFFFFNDRDCGSNSFQGSLSVTNPLQLMPFVVVIGGMTGGNTIRGDVSVTNSNLYIGGNTIGGDLLCLNTVVHVVAPNAITGRNTCY